MSLSEKWKKLLVRLFCVRTIFWADRDQSKQRVDGEMLLGIRRKKEKKRKTLAWRQPKCYKEQGERKGRLSRL